MTPAWLAACAAGLWIVASACSSSGSPQARTTRPATTASAAVQVEPATIVGVEVTQLEAGAAESQAAVLVSADRPLIWTQYRGPDGNLYIELPNSRLGPGIESLFPPEGLVAAVEIDTEDATSRPLARLRIRTRDAADHEITVDAETLRLVLTRQAAGQAPPETAAMRAAEAPAGQRQVAVPPKPAPPPPPEPEPAADSRGQPARTLLAIELVAAGEGAVIDVLGDGSFSYTTFRLEAPDRFVIDLEGVVSEARPATLEIRNAVVQRVRVGQFAPPPNPVARVVFDLDRDLEPVLRGNQRGLRVSFGVESTAPAAPEAAERSAADDLAVALERQIREYRRAHPEVSEEDVRRALEILLPLFARR